MTATDIIINQPHEIDSILDSPLKILLVERGFIPNVSIVKLFSMSKKGPNVFKVGQTMYSLRSEESDLVLVK